MLNQIGLKHGTDKTRVGNITKKSGYTYLDIYEHYFDVMKNNELKILEIGIDKGHSLKMWEEYFPNGQIYGIDIENCKKCDTDRIKTFVCNQNNREGLEKISKKHGKFDIIIDDGCHLNEYIMKSFNVLWEYLEPWGYYCIEDLHNSYIEHPADEIDQQRIDRSGMDDFFNGLINRCDNGDVFHVCFYPSLCIIQKGK